MALHLLKLCVGADSLADLQARTAERRRSDHARGIVHTTRMVPKRVDELLDGGALFWVVKGQIAARQTLLDVEPFTDESGVGRCRLHLGPDLVAVLPRPCRPFQGWRYLSEADRPVDLASGWRGLAVMPEAMRRELRDLCLL